MNPKVRAKKDEATIGAFFREKSNEIVIGGPIRWESDIHELIEWLVIIPEVHEQACLGGLGMAVIEKNWKMARSRVLVTGASDATWQTLLQRLERTGWTLTHVRTFRRLLG